jgi:hypothetical protein
VVLLFSRNLHDPALPVNVQTTSVRLLLNLVDFIFHNNEAKRGQGKHLLIHILKTLVAKFDTLRFHMVEASQSPDCLELHDIDQKKAKYCSAPSTLNSEALPNVLVPEPLSNALLSSPADYVLSSVKPLVQTLVRGLKTVMWCISHYHQGQNEASKMKFSRRYRAMGKTGANESSTQMASMSYLLSQEEAETISLFFYWGLLCCRVIVNMHATQRYEFKEILDNFAGAFTVLERSNMLSTVGQHVPMLYDALLGSPTLLAIAQTLLANSNVFQLSQTSLLVS